MTLTWQAVGVIIAILVHASFVIWWASKLTSRMDVVKDTLVSINRELEKRDVQMAAAWKKIDGISTRLTRVETKVEIQNKEDE